MSVDLICSECTKKIDRIPDGHSVVKSLCESCYTRIMREIDPSGIPASRISPHRFRLTFEGFGAFKKVSSGEIQNKGG